MKKVVPYLLLQLLFLFYSFCGILSKTAAKKEFLSLEWILLYGGMIAILGIYAILWQQMLKRIPLNIAYPSKAVGIIWGIIWGVIFFGETVDLKHIIGAVIVIAGVLMMIMGSEKKDE